MKPRKTTEITIETHEVWVIRRANADAQFRCADCDDQLTMVTVDQAVEITRVSARTIYAWVETSKLHFWETAEGKLLVCLNSLPLYPQARD
jgi:hypothetical protein